MRRRSIRWRITALAVVSTVIVLAVVGVIVSLVLRAELRESLDRSLQQRADQIEALVLAGDAGALANRNDEDRFAQVLDADGDVVGATSNVIGAPPLAELPSSRQEAETRSDLPLEDDAYRVLVRRFDVAGQSQYVVVGENVDDVTDSVDAVTYALVVAFGVAAALLGVLTWWLVGRTLRPVESIRQEVTRIGLADLDHRVPTPGTADEIDRLATTMNEMLGRLEDAAAQQRRFVADVSHELRTPLTRLRTALEVDLSTGDADLAETARSALGDVVELQRLVDDLLFLARVDAGRVALRAVPVDLDAVAEVEVALLDAPVQVEQSLDPVVVTGDADQLARLVRNLLANAVRHATSRVRLTTTSEADGGAVVLAVDDDGPGIAPSDRVKVFDRFVRLDEARGATTGGAGLGLAIARDIVELHGGSIEAVDGPLGGARLLVRFPPGELRRRAPSDGSRPSGRRPPDPTAP